MYCGEIAQVKEKTLNNINENIIFRLNIMVEYETAEIDGEKIKYKKGALHRQLKIPEDENIGRANLMKIKKAEIGDNVSIKGKDFKVTALLKKRAVFALTLMKGSK